MHINKIIFLYLIILITPSCVSQHANNSDSYYYKGIKYPVTTHIAFYYNPEYISANYYIIAKAVFFARDNASDAQIRNYIEATAKEIGADAVLLGAYKKEPAGLSSHMHWKYYYFQKSLSDIEKIDKLNKNNCWNYGEEDLGIKIIFLKDSNNIE